eukprot:TRINITY_DN5456_c0_g1_i5.p1 TRINITY_DN5456_c0_g1~~TRINITY_DN5456_c0_g1_i5.p1  ORF type:complete len:1424 (+),score=301.44 TRINITY_DN5456_c0_g1_i5:49-4272(+)
MSGNQLSQKLFSYHIRGASLATYTPDQIRKMSVKEVTVPITFDNLEQPVPGGLYDPAFGPLYNGICSTCSQTSTRCPGHFGHIQLPFPLYNPLFFDRLRNLLNTMCWNCHRFKLDRAKIDMFLEILECLNCGDMARSAEVMSVLVGPKAIKLDEGSTAGDGDDGMRGEDESESGRGGRMEQKNIEEDSDAFLRVHDTRSITRERYHVLGQFISACNQTKICTHCNAVVLSLKVESKSKLFQERLSRKHVIRMRQEGVTYGIPGESDLNNSIFQFHFDREDCLQLDGDDTKDTNNSIDTEEKRDDTMSESEDEDGFFSSKRSTPVKKTPDTPSRGKKGTKKTNKKPLEAQRRSKKGEEEMEIESGVSKQRYLHPTEIRKRLGLLWENEKESIGWIWSGLGLEPGIGKKKRFSSADMFFVSVIAVPPSRFRPPSDNGRMVSEHKLNVYLNKILSEIEVLRSEREGWDSDESPLKIGELTVSMQNELNKFMIGMGADSKGIKQVLEKKEGMFRRNMMGKRVNFAGRTVISPDPYIETSEIGIPLYFAKSLTYPEPVTDHNVSWLRELVINGPNIYPGARSIREESGKLVLLPDDINTRKAIARTLQKPEMDESGGPVSGGKTVMRHCMDGDLLLVNRQPTLHKPSIMGHRARVLGEEKTIHMHYANCNTYNADFDGDEMNVHLPQNEFCRAEARFIANTDNQYVVPKDGTPLRGLIQDSIVSGVYLTCKDTFFTRGEFQQLVYFCCFNVNPSHPFVTPLPTILRPLPLFTGKQVVSAVLDQLLVGEVPLNMVGTSQIPSNMWGKGQEEGEVIIRKNQLLTGILGKKQFGNKPHGLVHCVYELYGGEAAGRLLTILGKLFIFFLQMRGFTCGIEDLLIDEESEQKRTKILSTVPTLGMVNAGIFTKMLPEGEHVDDFSKLIEKEKKLASLAKKKQEGIMSRLKELLADPSHFGNWDATMISRVSKQTTAVIQSCTGLVKPFPKNNFSMMTTSGAKGSRVNFSQVSCLLGQQELEGKRVPLMDSGKTLPCFTPFDPSPRAGGFVGDRFLTGIRPPEYFFHCMAGREGLIDTAVKTSRSGYLQRCIIKHLEGLTVSYDNTVRDSDGSVIQFNYGEDSVDVMNTGFLTQFDFLLDNLEAVENKYQIKRNKKIIGVVSDETNKLIVESLSTPHPKDPLFSLQFPNKIGVVSEKFYIQLEKYISQNLETKFSGSKGSKKARRFRDVMYMKYMRSLAHPGENVGTLAGQSIGEPSTQMTLNTFHLAGKGEVNVTLGIPRLRELIMAAGGNMKTPSMILPLRDQANNQESAKRLCSRFQRVMLNTVIDEITVKDNLITQKERYTRRYEISFKFSEEEIATNHLTWAHVKKKIDFFFFFFPYIRRKKKFPRSVGFFQGGIGRDVWSGKGNIIGARWDCE